MNTLKNPSPKKIKKAKKVYDIYLEAKSLRRTREITGLGLHTIQRYVGFIEELNNRNKLSSKDRYYNTDIERDSPPSCNTSEYNENIGSCQVDNKKNIEIVKNIANNIEIEIDTEADSEIEENRQEVGEIDEVLLTDKKNIDEKSLKNTLLSQKLNRISMQYLKYLEEPTEQQLRKTSLKDHAVIAGILLDKKLQLEHKSAEAVKNQSIIFNLFGNNKNLNSFITSVVKRQQELQDRPVRKYTPSISK